MIFSPSFIQKRVAVCMLLIAIFSGMFFNVPRAHAESERIEAMRAQIAQLIKLVAILQEKQLIMQRKKYEDFHQTDTNIIHANSYVEATTRVTLYKNPEGGSTVGKQSKGDGGDIAGGPRLIDGEIWWKVAFTDGDEGWVLEKNLERIPSVAIYMDKDGDGVKEKITRILGDYNAERFILFPHEKGLSPVYIEEDMDLLKLHDNAYLTGQLSKTVDGSPAIMQSDPYDLDEIVKGKSTSVPIAWTAENVPMNARVDVQVEALRLVDSPISGGGWGGPMPVGDVVGVYFWNIEGEGRIGAGDYRSLVRIKECDAIDCPVLAQSPYRYFSIQNP